MEPEEAAPCRHAGAPPLDVINSVSRLIQGLGGEDTLLNNYGLSSQEYREALPAAIEILRGRMSANTKDKRRFLTEFFQGLLAGGSIQELETPKYGKDTIYRLTVTGFGDVAVIKKGVRTEPTTSGGRFRVGPRKRIFGGCATACSLNPVSISSRALIDSASDSLRTRRGWLTASCFITLCVAVLSVPVLRR